MAQPEHHDHDTRHVSPNVKLGLTLFGVYLLLYLGFMGIAAFKYDLFGTSAPGGVNLAIAYGMGLIIAALVLSLVYMVFAKPD
ncbi:MAG TPA: DUF485 domain-containing protein [Tepidisphaeraceae bacterium]|nr:DUF485 domain-containing protein [Tepidisphaeraceae bacterium]